MHITLVDDSIAFDGFSPGSRPLGGAEKAFASLPGALARLGHHVHVFNRARFPMIIEGAHWETLDKSFPAQTDLLIAFRKPALLSSVRLAGKRMLWTAATGRQLEPARPMLDSFRAGLIFISPLQAEGWKVGDGSTPLVVRPGLRAEFLGAGERAALPEPVAVVTSHPSHGLDWLLDRWRDGIRPAVPSARLLVVSAVLDKGRSGGEVPEALRPVLDKALASPGVEIVPPANDAGMAALYRGARSHFYPGHADDMGCWTLRESQACGTPAVARPLGAVRECLVDGSSGQMAPDDAAFVNLAVRQLTDDDCFWSMSREARLAAGDYSWDDAAEQFAVIAGVE